MTVANEDTSDSHRRLLYHYLTLNFWGEVGWKSLWGSINLDSYFGFALILTMQIQTISALLRFGLILDHKNQKEHLSLSGLNTSLYNLAYFEPKCQSTIVIHSYKCTIPELNHKSEEGRFCWLQHLFWRDAHWHQFKIKNGWYWPGPFYFCICHQQMNVGEINL